MLAVAPRARGARHRRGAHAGGARAGGRRRAPGAWSSRRSTRWQAAHRLYARLGFVPVPERDWGHEYVHLRVQTWTPPEAPGALVESATWPPAAGRSRWTAGGSGLSGGLTRRGNSALLLGRPSDVTAARPGRAGLRGGGAAGDRARVPGGAARSGRPARAARRRGDVPDRRPGPRARRDETPPRPVRTAAGPVRISVADRPDDAWLAAWSGSKARLHATGAAAEADETSLRLARAVLGGVPALYLTRHRRLGAGRRGPGRVRGGLGRPVVPRRRAGCPSPRAGAGAHAPCPRRGCPAGSASRVPAGRGREHGRGARSTPASGSQPARRGLTALPGPARG